MSALNYVARVLITAWIVATLTAWSALFVYRKHARKRRRREMMNPKLWWH